MRASTSRSSRCSRRRLRPRCAWHFAVPTGIQIVGRTYSDADVVVVGRGITVGRPLGLLLTRRGAPGAAAGGERLGVELD